MCTHQVDDVVQLEQVVHALPARDQADDVPAHGGRCRGDCIHYQAVQQCIAARRLLATLQSCRVVILQS